ncbi:hypothetical protein MBBAR_25c00030 [Methanobrevibacter arboriphilus JCM 13429 = DSM 1125]|uniref:Uncharacterized protein n=1 Tax=Methanobrevibacter arboriphilus JCM 13429 = DSM 1125 TaxID=1300164 RepID=A0A1V6N0E1_METAZ|nr:hypothetical protein [Methanobrevibacter arboriphilus]OQD58190.1 hypothetical protein MBBAR_25c00030 [Methanobrevibacter arboriphilus JCM 13429 = DSM 1125]
MEKQTDILKEQKNEQHPRTKQTLEGTHKRKKNKQTKIRISRRNTEKLTKIAKANNNKKNGKHFKINKKT